MSATPHPRRDLAARGPADECALAIAAALKRLAAAGGHEVKTAHELRPGEELADGSSVIGVEEILEQPLGLHIEVHRGGEVFRLSVLRTTPVAMARRP